jgi:hypothetical protein
LTDPMIRFETKPRYHKPRWRSPSNPCLRCQVAAREGALAVHVLKVSELLEEATRIASERPRPLRFGGTLALKGAMDEAAAQSMDRYGYHCHPGCVGCEGDAVEIFEEWVAVGTHEGWAP